MSTLSLRKIKHDSSSVDNITLTSTGQSGFNTSTPSGQVGIKSSGANGLVLETDSADSTCSTRIFAKNDTYTGGVYFDNTGWNITTGSSIGSASGSSRLNITRDGYVRTPNQPFFAGYHNNVYATTYTGGNVIPVSIAITNIGNHFNTSNYTFTCPVDGIYEVIMSDISTASDTAALGIYVNGSVKSKFYMQSVRQRFHASMFFASANDAVTFRVVEGSCTLYGDSNYGRYQIRLVG